MIYDKLENVDKYFNQGDSIYEAVCFARDKAAAMPNGNHDLDGDRLSARVMTYITQPAELRKFEYHRKYIDVQVMLEGRERHDVSPATQLKPIGTFDEENDILFLEPPELFATVNLEPGWFAVYFPHDNHRPNCSIGEPSQVRKVCMKVKA